MTVALDIAAKAQISQSTRGVAWLLDLEGSTGTLRFTTWATSVDSGGNSYIAAGNLIEVVPFTESENTTTARLVLRFSLVNAAMLSLAIVDPDIYRGRPVRLALQLFDADGRPVGAAVPRWAGYMDKMAISREKGQVNGGNISGKIELQCSRGGLARARNYDGLRLTSAQQQQRFPGDKGLDYVPNLIEQPSLWLSKKFQEV